MGLRAALRHLGRSVRRLVAGQQGLRRIDGEDALRHLPQPLLVGFVLCASVRTVWLWVA